MKGISPLIAIVLLVAFTVAVGAILSVWLTGFAGEQAETTGTFAEKVSKCAAVSIAIDNVTTTRFRVTHETGSYEVTNVEVTFENATTASASPVSCSPSTLSVGGVCYVTSDIANPIRARAVGMCLGEISKSATWEA